MYNRHGGGARDAEGVNVRHDVVAELVLLLLRQLVVDVRQVRLGLGLRFVSKKGKVISGGGE